MKKNRKFEDWVLNGLILGAALAGIIMVFLALSSSGATFTELYFTDVHREDGTLSVAFEVANNEGATVTYSYEILALRGDDFKLLDSGEVVVGDMEKIKLDRKFGLEAGGKIVVKLLDQGNEIYFHDI